MVVDVNGRPIILAASDADDGVNKVLSFKILESDARQYFEVHFDDITRITWVLGTATDWH